jgi:hypothetical protein
MYVPAEMFLIPALVAIVMAALASYALRRARRPLAPGQPPLCGACGYSTQGLTTLTCPECGSDLRVVGIGAGVTRRMPRLIHFAACAIFLSFLMYPLQTTLTNLVMPMLLSPLEYSNDIRVTSRGDPSRSFAIRATGRGGATPVTIEMQLRGGGGGGGTQRFTLLYDPARAVDFGPRTVLDWMIASRSAAGPPLSDAIDPAVPMEAARVAGLARKGARYTRGREHADWAYGGSGGSRSSSGAGGVFASYTEDFAARPSRVTTIMVQVLRVLWGILWLALLIVLFRAIVLPRVSTAAFTPPPGRD